ncbi:MAG: S6e family ribosomal protein [Nanoarchaeota archaeon]
MPEFKIVISEKGKSYAKTLTNEEGEVFLNKKIKDKIEGGHFNFKGYEFEITGGSDKEGFPMRTDVEGLVRKRIFITKGRVGARIKKKGIRIRKSVANNLISQNTSQINLKVIKTGSKLLNEIFGKTLKEAPQEEVKKEKAKE